MKCPYCGEELEYHDYYGFGNPNSNNFKKIGEIFKCENEDCEAYEEHFHTKENDDELYEGYPC